MITYILALLLSRQCETDTAWVELPSMVPVCGDADGIPQSYPRLLPGAGIVYYLVATPETQK